MKRALFIVAHPDDAELAAGGTIKMLVESGCEVKVLTLTISEKSTEMRSSRKWAACRAAQILGYEPLWFENGKYDHVADIKMHTLVAYFDQLVKSFQPNAVFSHWQEDSHWDHICTARAILASSRKWEAALYAFPPNELKTPAYLKFIPNTFVDISPYIEHKTEAIRQYTYPGQHYKALDEQDFKNINHSNGIQINCQYAEIFQLLRQEGLGIQLIQPYPKHIPSNQSIRKQMRK